MDASTHITDPKISKPHDDHPVASTLRFIAGVFSVVAGVSGALYAAWLWLDGGELASPLDAMLPAPLLSKIAFSMISLGAAGGGILWLRGAATGVPVCSGTWATVAALAARPSVVFNYSGKLTPTIQLPAEGRSTIVIILFAGAAALSLLTHSFSGVTRRHEAKLHATTGETLVSAFLLVSGLSAAIQFQIDSTALGSVVVEKALLPLVIFIIALHAIGLGVLGGFALARAGAMILLISIASTAILPDLLFERVQIAMPLFWATALTVGAASLLLPRRLHLHHS